MERDEQLAVLASGWPVITDGDLARIAARLAAHHGPQPAQITWRSSRPMAASCLARLPDGTEVFVKRHDPALVDRAGLQAQHDYVNALVGRGFPTVGFLAFADGSSVADEGGWRYEVSLRGIGEDRYRQATSWTPPGSSAEAIELGRQVAVLQRLSEALPAVDTGPGLYQTRVRLLLGDPFENLSGWLAERPVLVDYLARADRDLAGDLDTIAGFARRLAPLAAGPMTWTHGDLHVSNTLWDGDRISCVIDFGLAAVNPGLVDLAMAIERHAIDWLAIVAGDDTAWRPDTISQIVCGYRRERALTPQQADLLPDLIAVVQAEFALGVVEYCQQAPVPAGNAEWSYDVYFNAHNRWFASDAGARFADAVRVAASQPLEEMP